MPRRFSAVSTCKTIIRLVDGFQNIPKATRGISPVQAYLITYLTKVFVQIPYSILLSFPVVWLAQLTLPHGEKLCKVTPHAICTK